MGPRRVDRGVAAPAAPARSQNRKNVKTDFSGRGWRDDEIGDPKRGTEEGQISAQKPARRAGYRWTRLDAPVAPVASPRPSDGRAGAEGAKKCLARKFEPLQNAPCRPPRKSSPQIFSAIRELLGSRPFSPLFRVFLLSQNDDFRRFMFLRITKEPPASELSSSSPDCAPAEPERERPRQRAWYLSPRRGPRGALAPAGRPGFGATRPQLLIIIRSGVIIPAMDHSRSQVVLLTPRLSVR